MNFDLTAEQDFWLHRARHFAVSVVAELARQIDDRDAVPPEIHQVLSLGNPFEDGALAASVAVEELAAISAGVATAIGLEWAGATTRGGRRSEPNHAALPGLRGSGLIADPSAHPRTERARLVLSSIANGVGRAAIGLAVQFMKSRDIKAAGDEPTPHWALADGATEVDAARLLTRSAAQAIDRGEAADSALSIAATLASTAAERAVEAAGRILGVEGYRLGSPLERLTRDARTLKLLLVEAGL